MENSLTPGLGTAATIDTDPFAMLSCSAAIEPFTSSLETEREICSQLVQLTARETQCSPSRKRSYHGMGLATLDDEDIVNQVIFWRYHG